MPLAEVVAADTVETVEVVGIAMVVDSEDAEFLAEVVVEVAEEVLHHPVETTMDRLVMETGAVRRLRAAT